MAYAVKYRLRGESVKYKNDVRIDIEQDGYSGSILNKYIGAGGIQKTKAGDGVINGTSLTFSMQADSSFEYLEFFEAGVKDYLVKLYVNDTLDWIGYIVTDEHTEEFKDPPYDITVRCADGLGLLKTYDYVPVTNATTRTTRVETIFDILDNTGLDLDLLIAYDVEIDALIPNLTLFRHAEFQDDYYRGWNCYEVLETIIPPDATITQKDGKWLIRRNEQDSEKTHLRYYRQEGGIFVASVSGESVLNLGTVATGDIYPIGTAELNMRHAWKDMVINNELVRRSSFLRNADFSEGLDEWTESATGFASVWELNGDPYLRLTGTSALESDGEWVEQTIPWQNQDGFSLELKYSVVGYKSVSASGIYEPINTVLATISVSVTDGVDTYYLNQYGWVRGNIGDYFSPFFDEILSPNPVDIEWKDLKIYADSPPVGGTLTIKLYRCTYRGSQVIVGTNFSNVNIKTFAGEDYLNVFAVPVPLKTNGIDSGNVSLLPCDAPNISNFDSIFYNSQSFMGNRAVDYTANGTLNNTLSNILINSLKFCNGVTRQIISGQFRGANLHLNAVCQSVDSANRKYFVKGGVHDLLNDKINIDWLEIPGTATGSSWTVENTDYSALGQWTDGTTSGGGGSSRVGGSSSNPNYTGVYVSQDWFNEYFEIVDEGTTGEYIRALRNFASTGDIIAYNSAAPTGSFWDDLPIATTGTLGGVIVGAGLMVDENGVISASGGGGGSGVTQTLSFVNPNLTISDGNTVDLSGLQPSGYATESWVTGNFSSTGHNHSTLYQPLDGDLTAIAALTGSGFPKRTGVNAWTMDGSTYATQTWVGLNYEPAFTKNTAFNKDFGTTVGTITQGNDSRLSDARTPLSHTHGNVTNDGKIGSTSGVPIITTTGGALTAGSFGTTAGTFTEGNDSRFHTHTNKALLDAINQSLATGSDARFNAMDATTGSFTDLAVNSLVSGLFQTGAGTNLLLTSDDLSATGSFVKSNLTATEDYAVNPFGGDSEKSWLLHNTSATGEMYQGNSHSTTGNYTFSFWAKGATGTNVAVRLYSNSQTTGAYSTHALTTSWQRFTTTFNFTSSHSVKTVKLFITNDVQVYGLQLEPGTAPTRYIRTRDAAITAKTAAHCYTDLLVDGIITASKDVVAYSDQRLKRDIKDTPDLLGRLNMVRVVDYRLNEDSKQRTGVIAQELLELFPQFVTGSHEDYYAINYAQMVSVAIKAIQELSAKVQDLENQLKTLKG